MGYIMDHTWTKKLPDLKTHLIFWSLALVGFAMDLWTKSAVFNWLANTDRPRESFTVIEGFFYLVTAENPGAAFGIAAGRQFLLISVSVIALVVILMTFLFSGSKQRIVHIAMGLFTAGICGNLYDRIFNNGYVRDFIDILYWPGRHWPAFNIADSMLCIGVGLLLISILTDRHSQTHGQQQK